MKEKVIVQEKNQEKGGQIRSDVYGHWVLWENIK